MMFWKKKGKGNPRDPFEGFFGGMDNFENIEKMMDEMMKDLMSGSRIERAERKPLVMGFSIKVGEDGLPKIEEFGNVKVQKDAQPRISREREPLTDLREEPKEIVITAELPGISEKELELKVEGKKILLNAKSKENSFKKEISLPSEVNASGMKKIFKNGVLELVLPRKGASRSAGARASKKAS